jgi:TonB family protein
MRALAQVIGSVFILLLSSALLAYPQDQGDFPQRYVGQPFLIRQHGGLHEVVKINKRDASAYKGVCDKAVQVLAAKLAKRAVQFDVADIGLVMAPYGTPRGCTHADETRITKLLISGFSKRETQDEMQTVIGRILQTPEAYLDTHPSIIPAVETLNPSALQAAKLILQVTPWYPPGIRGPLEVNLQISVGTEGKVQNVQVEKGSGSGLDIATLRVLPLWRYEPARKNGQAVPSSTSFRITYNMEQERPSQVPRFNPIPKPQ